MAQNRPGEGLMRKKFYGRRLFAVCLVCCLMLGLPPSGFADAAAPKLNRKKITLSVGEKMTLKVKNAKGTVKWSSSNKKVASVSKGAVRAKKRERRRLLQKSGKRS